MYYLPFLFSLSSFFLKTSQIWSLLECYKVKLLADDDEGTRGCMIFEEKDGETSPVLKTDWLIRFDRNLKPVFFNMRTSATS